MWRILALTLVIVVVVVSGFSLIDTGGGDVEADAVLEVRAVDNAGFTRAFEPREWSFPRDHGAHSDYQTEWWYYTGNIATEEGRRFGFQFTIFRRALNPQLISTDSEWRTSQAYMAHFSLSDIEGNTFYHDERYSRGGAGLAGALPNENNPEARYRVWLENWETYALDDDVSTLKIVADAGTFAVDFTMDATKPYILQGIDGLSQKSDAPGNASQYYSLPRLDTEGTIRIGADTYTVSGTTWMDREFSTSVLGDDAQGWDWFAFQLDDGREVVLGQIRLKDGNTRTSYTGTMIYEDGSYQHLEFDQYSIEVTDEWRSPHTDALYPAGWVITLDAAVVEDTDDLELIVTPQMADQELNSGDIAYWEGSVRISGDATGYGYAELTGYTEQIAGRF